MGIASSAIEFIAPHKIGSHNQEPSYDNQAFYQLIRDSVPVSYRDAKGELRHA